MVEHVSITDPNLHEPKGISTAASGALYVANGSGSGVWTARKSFSVAPVFSQLSFANNATVTTLTNQNQFYQVAGTYTLGPNSGVTQSTTQFTIVTPGTYEVDWYGSLEQGGAAGYNYDIGIGVNGTQTGPVIQRWVDNSGNVGAAALSCLLSLSAADTVYLMAANKDAANKTLLVSHSTLKIKLVKEA